MQRQLSRSAGLSVQQPRQTRQRFHYIYKYMYKFYLFHFSNKMPGRF